jgi:gas vesicle protein
MKKSTSNFLIGVLIGAAGGAIAGVLYAPDKGSETRKKIKDKADHLKDDVSEKFDEIKKQVEETVDHLKGVAKEARKEEPAAKRTSRAKKTS